MKPLLLSAVIALTLTACTQLGVKKLNDYKQFNNVILPTSVTFQSFQDGKAIIPVIKGNGFVYNEAQNKPIMLVFSTGDVLVLSDKETSLNGAVLKAPSGTTITLNEVNGKIEAVY